MRNSHPACGQQTPDMLTRVQSTTSRLGARVCVRVPPATSDPRQRETGVDLDDEVAVPLLHLPHTHTQLLASSSWRLPPNTRQSVKMLRPKRDNYRGRCRFPPRPRLSLPISSHSPPTNPFLVKALPCLKIVFVEGFPAKGAVGKGCARRNGCREKANITNDRKKRP